MCLSCLLRVSVGSPALTSSHLSRRRPQSDQRVKFQLGGVLGKIVNMFGGKGAREGVISIVAVKGNRKATMSDATGQIIDLTEEKIYDLDIKKKTYTVTTFAELRKRMEEARREAEKSAREAAGRAEPSKPAEKDPERQGSSKSTSTSRTRRRRAAINGFNTTQERDDRSPCVKRARPSTTAAAWS